jgi:hypothetical protein
MIQSMRTILALELANNNVQQTHDNIAIGRLYAFLRDAAIETIRKRTTTHSSPRLRLHGTPVSKAAFLLSVSADGTKLGWERST